MSAFRRVARDVTWLTLNAVIGCGGDATTASPPPNVATVELTTPSDPLRKGDVVRIIATLRDASGTTVFGHVDAWTTSDANVAVVDQLGNVRGVVDGTATITATAQHRQASVNVNVYTPVASSIELSPLVDSVVAYQQLRLVAVLRDQTGRWIQEARATRWSSSDTSVASVVGFGNNGLVTGAAAGSSVITVVSENAHANATIVVRAGPPPAQLGGAWTMTVSISPTCRDRFPANARTRQYSAIISQQGSSLALMISSPSLENDGPGSEAGSVVGSAVTVSLGGDMAGGSYLHDHLSELETLDFGGAVTGIVADSEIHAVMNGEIDYWYAPAAWDGPLASCRAMDHVVTLRR